MMTMLKYFLSCLFLSFFCNCDCLHLTGNWNTGQFFKFLAKFGFQKTDNHDHINTLGFIYGNITSQGYDASVKHKATFVVVDRQNFLDFYRQRVKYDFNRNEVCKAMFEKIDTVSYDRNCKQNGTEDFLRRVPCPINELCEDEDSPERVVNGYQFTYAVQDNNQARFWYISLVACYREGADNNCTWKESSAENLNIDYDIWLANGNPYGP
ncbi:hypothetical protein X975_04533, partial [Stegodyphus mimosarum]